MASKIEVRNVSKQFGSTRALNNISVVFEQNKIYGLLGRNGAGKTTLINIVTNKYFPDSGEVLLDGELVVENDKALSKIACMTAITPQPEDMKVKDAFKWAKEFNRGFDHTYANNLAAKFSLNNAKRIKDLSTGYLSIFKLMLTLSSNLPVIIFDEPVLGLDANYREFFYRELIENYSKQEKTIIISTHLIDEVAEIVEEVVVIEHGRILLAQSVDEIVRQGYTVSGDSTSVDEFMKNRNVIREDSLGRYKSATIFQDRTVQDDAEIARLSLDVSPARLQELFVALTNRREEVVTGARD